MEIRAVLIACLCLLPAVAPAADPPPIASWIDGLKLPPSRPPRPKPSEPDATRDNSGPFRLADEFEQAVPADPPPRVQAPQVYRLADAWGQRWQHSDPAWLQSWVATRNASAVRYQYGGTVCGPGGCPPRR